MTFGGFESLASSHYKISITTYFAVPQKSVQRRLQTPHQDVRLRIHAFKLNLSSQKSTSRLMAPFVRRAEAKFLNSNSTIVMELLDALDADPTFTKIALKIFTTPLGIATTVSATPQFVCKTDSCFLFFSNWRFHEIGTIGLTFF